MYKLIVSDLDETLVGHDGTASAENIAAIRAAAALGVKFVPNTGRNFASVQPLLQAIGTYQQPDQYVISYNGGAVVENAGNEIVVSNQMPYAHAEKLFQLMAAYPEVSVHIYSLNHLYVYNPRPDDTAYLSSRGVEYREMPDTDFTRFKNKHIMKLIFMNPDIKVRHEIAEAIDEQVHDWADLTYSSGRYAEFNPKGVNKGSATLELAERLGIKPEEIIAFGDNSNDLPMFRVVGMPVAVSNAIPEAKDMAKLVTNADFETGVAEAIHKLILDK